MRTPNAVPPLSGYLPTQAAHTYEPIGHCVYCGSINDLSDEHIIPLGFGGRLILPKASCASCSKKTSKIERTCLRTMYGPLRLLYDLSSRRKKSRPETLQLKVKRTESSEWEYVSVDQERYPFLITFPYFEAPGALTILEESDAGGPASSRLWIRGASPHHDFFSLLQSLSEELGVHSLMPESKAEVPQFCSLLAKIAVSYVAAEKRVALQKSRIADIAIGEEMQNCLHYIGSAAKDEPPSPLLHELSIGHNSRGGSYVVRIRLLAKLATPTYFVVVPVESSANFK
jgi:hypothetical protein